MSLSTMVPTQYINPVLILILPSTDFGSCFFILIINNFGFTHSLPPVACILRPTS